MTQEPSPDKSEGLNGNSLLLVPGIGDGDEENLAGLIRKQTVDDVRVITNSKTVSN